MHHQLLRRSRLSVAFSPGGCAHELRQGGFLEDAQEMLHGSGSASTLLLLLLLLLVSDLLVFVEVLV